MAEEAKTTAPKAPQVPSQPKPQAEKQANCLACGKPIKKIKHYYRNGKYYCSKKCWKAFLTKAKEEKKT